MADGDTFEVKRQLPALAMFKANLQALGEYMDDPSVQEIMVNRADDIWIERGGDMHKIDVQIPPTNIEAAVRALASANDKDVNKVLDCRMPGYRIAAAMKPVAINGSAICIRKHARSLRALDDYLDDGGFGKLAADYLPERGLIAPPADEVSRGGQPLADYLRWTVLARRNIVIVGSTGSGKTTFLNALLTLVPHTQRVVTIEDTAELRVTTPNYVGLEAMPDLGVSIRALVRLSLRFRPDRIVLGEVRGPEAYDLLDAMNTGHAGGACSLHADSPLMGLSRLESLVRMNPDAQNLPLSGLRQQIADTVGCVIYCSRRGKRRGPEQVLEVNGVDASGNYNTRVAFDARH